MTSRDIPQRLIETDFTLVECFETSNDPCGLRGRCQLQSVLHQALEAVAGDTWVSPILGGSGLSWSSSRPHCEKRWMDNGPAGMTAEQLLLVLAQICWTTCAGQALTFSSFR